MSLALAFGLASALAIAVNLLAAWCLRSAASPGLWLAIMIFVTWLVTNALRATTPLPWAWLPSPIMDVLCLAICCAVAARTRQWWAWALAFTFMAELCLHAVYFSMLPNVLGTPQERPLSYTYVLWRNIFFGAQVALGAWPGVSYGLGLLRGPRLFGVALPAGRRRDP